MKHKTHHLYYLFRKARLAISANLFRPPGLIIIALLLCNTIATAQESTPPEEFPIGSSLSGIPWRRTQWDYYTSFDSSGMNTILQYSNDITQSRLDPYNLVAYNMDQNDWIMYYATCYYSKWEAEQNQTEDLRVGVKHRGGEKVFWNDAWCWSTRNVIAPACSLIFGPHYRQDNRYKSHQHGERHDVKYYVRFKMALDNPQSENPDKPICNIKVVYRYLREHTQGPPEPKQDTVFLSRTLTVGDFPDSGHFAYFKFDPEWYQYPQQFWLPKDAGKLLYTPEDTIWYNDVNDDIGIQFWVDWLVDDVEESGLTLYVDNIEVYDEDWKESFVDQSPEIPADQIRNYANNYCSWSNLKYWIGHDEPYSIDAFTPIRIVDSLLYNNPDCLHKHRLLNVFNPYWTWNNLINGDTLLFQYHRMAKPEKLFVDMYPFSPSYPTPRFEDFDYLRYTFQECATLDPSFWYQAQGFGQTRNGVPDIWRFPDSSELKASVMLALAHGSKGILFSTYDSWWTVDYLNGTDIIYIHGLVDTLNGTIPVTDLWYMIRDNLAPRLKGKLGNTLMNLDYTGNYINNECSSCGIHDNPSLDYLEIDCNVSSYFWHCGFFTHKDYPDNKHFLLTNLRTTVPVSTDLIVSNNTGYENVCFKDI